MIKKRVVLILSILIISIIAIVVEKDTINKFLYPKKYSQYVEKYSNKYNLDENLVYSVIKAESKFRPNAQSHKGAKGLMQISDITKDWAIEELGIKNIDIFNPETNIMLGCWYLNKLYKEFGNIDLVVAAYNGGSGNVKKWLNNNDYSKDGKILHNIPFEETSNYVIKVSKNYKKYSDIYNKKGRS